MPSQKENSIRWTEYSAEERNSLPPDEGELIEAAASALSLSYSPYSNFRVGSALRAGGRVVVGANVENAAYGPSNCGERTAIFSAFSQGLGASIQKIAVMGAPADHALAQGQANEVVTPCGPCRQVLKECEDLAGKKLIILCASVNGPVFRFEGVENLLPFAFGPASFMDSERLKGLRQG